MTNDTYTVFSWNNKKLRGSRKTPKSNLMNCKNMEKICKIESYINFTPLEL